MLVLATMAKVLRIARCKPPVAVHQTLSPRRRAWDVVGSEEFEMTANRQRKLAARAVSASTGRSYTQSLRAVSEGPAGPRWGVRLPSGQVHPADSEQAARELAAELGRGQLARVVCRQAPEPVAPDWVEVDPVDQKEIGRLHRLKLAADWHSRGTYLADRFPPKPARGMIMYGGNAEHSRGVYLHLVYDTLLADRPGLAPDPVAMAAARQAGNLAAVDALMHPLDRAARLFLGQAPEVFHAAVGAHAKQLAARDKPTRDWQRTDMLASYWHASMRERTNHWGYPTRSGFPVPAVRHILDAILVSVAGGHAPGERVELADGREAWVWDVQWSRWFLGRNVACCCAFIWYEGCPGCS
jgi:hypothetical protein